MYTIYSINCKELSCFCTSIYNTYEDAMNSLAKVVELFVKEQDGERHFQRCYDHDNLNDLSVPDGHHLKKVFGGKCKYDKTLQHIDVFLKETIFQPGLVYGYTQVPKVTHVYRYSVMEIPVDGVPATVVKVAKKETPTNTQFSFLPELKKILSERRKFIKAD